jgi:hypothetical protein
MSEVLLIIPHKQHSSTVFTSLITKKAVEKKQTRQERLHAETIQSKFQTSGPMKVIVT